MSGQYERLLPLATELDQAYQQALDRMETQLAETDGLNRQVSKLLEQDNLEIIPISSDAMSSPREVFSSFSSALSAKVIPELAMSPNGDGYRIHDLVDWTDMPPRGRSSDREYQLVKINHARTKSMQVFLKQMIIRFNPTALPTAAIHRAVQDVIQTFSVVTAMGIAVPVSRNGSPSLRYVYNRGPDDPMWQLLPRHHAAIVRGTNALATIALLNKQHGIASSLGDLLTSLDVRLSQTVMRYEAGQAFFGAAFLKLTLHRDGADFHFGQSLFDLLEQTLLEQVSDIHLVYH